MHLHRGSLHFHELYIGLDEGAWSLHGGAWVLHGDSWRLRRDSMGTYGDLLWGGISDPMKKLDSTTYIAAAGA